MPLSTEELERLVVAWFDHGARLRGRASASRAAQEEGHRTLSSCLAALAEASTRGDAAEVERLQAEFSRVSQALTETPEPGEWAAEHVRSIMFVRGEEAWRVLTELLRRAPDDESLEWIGVGPLETFLTDEMAIQFRDRIEEHLVGGRSLRVALAAAWGLPKSIRILAARYPPGPKHEELKVTSGLVERYIQFRRAWIDADCPAKETGQQRVLLRNAGLNDAEADLVRRLVVEVVRAVRADDLYAQALARLEGLAERRRGALDELRERMPPGVGSELLPDLDDPAAKAWFAEHDRDMRERVIGQFRPVAGREQRLAALREAWGDEAVSCVLARVDELAEAPNLEEGT